MENIKNVIRQGYSLLFSFRLLLNNRFDYFPILLFFINTIAYMYFITEFVIPVFCIYGDMPTDEQILNFVTNNPKADKYMWFENVFNYLFEISTITILAIFAKSKGFRFASKACLAGLFMLSISNGIYKITSMSIAFYYLLAFLVILCTFTVLTVNRLTNKVK